MPLPMTSDPDPLPRGYIPYDSAGAVARLRSLSRVRSVDAAARRTPGKTREERHASTNLEQFSFQIMVGGKGRSVDGYLARRRASPGRVRPPVLILDGSGGDARRYERRGRTRSLTELGLHLACVSIPGYGRSSGPSRFVGRQAVRGGPARARSARGAQRCRSQADRGMGAQRWRGRRRAPDGVDSRPRAVVLESGAYDMVEPVARSPNGPPSSRFCARCGRAAACSRSAALSTICRPSSNAAC